MSAQTIILKRLDSHPKVDNSCFFAFISNTGDTYFTFKGENRKDDTAIVEPPVGYEFSMFRCMVHDFVVPPKMCRVPSLLEHEEVGETNYAEEMVDTGGKPQLIRLISSFKSVEPQEGSYDYLNEDKQLQADDWSFVHNHNKHVTSQPSDEHKGLADASSMEIHGFDGTCPTILAAYGYPNELIEISFKRKAYEQEKLGVLPSWWEEDYPESEAYLVVVELSSHAIAYAYYPLTKEGSTNQFRKDFANAKDVVFGMPEAKAIDALDVLMIFTDQGEGITRPL